MSLTSTSNRVVATGDAVTVLFNYNKLLYDATHLQVYVAEVLQSTGYTVNGVPGTSTSVTFSVAPAAAAQVILLRVVPLTQLSVYAVGGAFPAATTEKNFDLLAMASQQFDDTTSRTLRQPLGDTVAIAELPATSARASQYMAFDANGDPTVMLGTSETPNVLLKTGGNLTGGINEKLTTVASATTPDIFALTVGNTIDYTGTATATGFAAAPQAGSQRTLVCAAASVFTAGANMLIDGTVSGQNFTAAAGDKLLVIAVTTTQFRLVPMLSSGIPANNGGFTTGDGKFTLKTAADVGWVMANDTSIGSATSGATGRANADTSALYTLIWTNMVDQYAPVATGRGGSAAADFAANKAMFLPKTLGRALAIGGTGTSSFSGVNADVDTATDGITVPTNNTKWITGMPVVFTLQSGTITGLTTATTYYIFRSSSILVKLCSSLANAQNGTVIDLTAKSSPVFTLVYSTAARILGEHSGEDAHAQSITELLAHTHSIEPANSTLSAGANAAGNTASGVTGSTGGNAAMNIEQPTSFWNAMIKL